MSGVRFRRSRLADRYPPPVTGHALSLLLAACDRFVLAEQLGRCLTRLQYSPYADDRIWADDVQARLSRHLTRNRRDECPQTDRMGLLEKSW